MERKLYRSKNNKVLLGVCGGVAEYIHADATLIRLIFLKKIIARILSCSAKKKYEMS